MASESGKNNQEEEGEGDGEVKRVQVKGALHSDSSSSVGSVVVASEVKLSNGFPSADSQAVSGGSDDEKPVSMHDEDPPSEEKDGKTGGSMQSTLTSTTDMSGTSGIGSTLESTGSSLEPAALGVGGSMDGLASEKVTEPEPEAVAYSPDSRFVKYDIVIGRGSFKTVYKGLDTETGVAVAWCELQENRYNKTEQVRFKEEVAILKTLQHPNILRLYDSWETSVKSVDRKDRKMLVLITELMTSGTLKGYMRRFKSIKPKVIRNWGRQILRGLHFLHTRSPPIIHRDLKCDNIFINGTTGLVKIGDLGLATLKRSDVKTVIGTPEFMAPEMYEESYDEQVDSYAFGMCLLEMSTQEYPYMECSNPAQIYKRVTSGIPPQAIERVKDPVLRDIIIRCTTLKKGERIQVKDLLNHDFFAEGVKVEVAVKEGDSTGDSTVVMVVEVPRKESKQNGQETLEFTYNLATDQPEEVVGEMVRTGLLRSEDHKNVSRSLREHLDSARQKLRLSQKEDGQKSQVTSSTTTGAPLLEPQDSDGGQQGKMVRQLSNTEGGDSDTGEGRHEPSTTSSTAIATALSSHDKGRVTPSTAPPQAEASAQRPPVDTSLASVDQPPSSLVLHNQTVEPVPSAATTPEVLVGTVDDKRELFPAVKSTVSGQEPPPLQPQVEESLKVAEGESKLTSTLSQSYSDLQSLESIQPASSEKQVEAVTQSASAEGSTDSQSNGMGKKKSAQRKTKPLKLTLIKVVNGSVVKCTLGTGTSQIINFQFSLEYDKPKEIFQKLVNAGHLMYHDQEEFIHQAKRLLSEAKAKLLTGDSSPPAVAKDGEARSSKAEPSDNKPAVVAGEPAKPSQLHMPESSETATPTVDPKHSDSKPTDLQSPTDPKLADSQLTDTKPEDAKSVDAKQVNVKPTDAKPVDAKPVDAKPVDAKPVNAKQVNVKPTDAKPVDAKPVDAKPVDAKPVDAKPVDAKPVDAKPVDAKPVDAKPVDAKPVDAKQVNMKPTDAKPVDAKPVDAAKPVGAKPEPVDVAPVDAKPELVDQPKLTELSKPLPTDSKVVETSPRQPTVSASGDVQVSKPVEHQADTEVMSGPSKANAEPFAVSQAKATQTVDSELTKPLSREPTPLPVINLGVQVPVSLPMVESQGDLRYQADLRYQTEPSCPLHLQPACPLPLVPHQQDLNMPLGPHPVVEPPLTTTASNKKFEVQDVAEVDSPPADLSCSSTETLEKEEAVGDSTSDPRKGSVAGSGGLESASTGNIGLMESLPARQNALQSGAWSSTPAFTQPYVIPYEVLRQRSASMQYATVTGVYPSANYPYNMMPIPEFNFFKNPSTPPTTSQQMHGEKTKAEQEQGTTGGGFVPVFASLPATHVNMLTEAFGRFLHSMNTMLRDPNMAPVLNFLDQQYSGSQQHHSPPTTTPSESTTTTSTAMPTPSSSEQDPGYQEIVQLFEHKKQQLEQRKKQALEDYHKRKVIPGAGDERNSRLRSSSLDRKVTLSEYQEGPRTVSSMSQHNEEREKMEQRVKEEILSEFSSASNPTSPPPTSNHTSVVDTTSTQSSLPVESTASPPPIHSQLSPRVSNPLREPKLPKAQSSSPSSSRHKAVFTTIPATASSPLQSSPPLLHGDSGEWTEYASASVSQAHTSSRGSVSTAAPPHGISTFSMQQTDLSEFDPIASGESQKNS